MTAKDRIIGCLKAAGVEPSKKNIITLATKIKMPESWWLTSRLPEPRKVLKHLGLKTYANDLDFLG